MAQSAAVEHPFQDEVQWQTDASPELAAVNGPPHRRAPGLRATTLYGLSGIDPADYMAVRSSWPGKLLGRTAVLIALIVLLLDAIGAARRELPQLDRVFSPPWVNWVLLTGFCLLVIAAQLLNEVRGERNRRAAARLAISPAAVPADYFRIGPYLDTQRDRSAFRRADGAHERVLDWLREKAAVPLYLTGDSGSGKSSLLNAFVLPALRDEGWAIRLLRASQDAEAAVVAALAPPRRTRTAPARGLIEAVVRRADSRLVLVLDQFEEFIILGSPERQQAFAALMADLALRPVEGLRILLVLRSDYQTLLEEAGLPRLVYDENLFQVTRFKEGAARAFLKNSHLIQRDDALDQLLKSAAEIDETPGMIRPITLNVLGYVVHEHGGERASSLDAGQLVNDYIEQAVENPVIRNWAPTVLEGLLTNQGTKRTRREDELAEVARLRPPEVRAVLHALAEAALARPLGTTQTAWELSHDFVARAISRYLGRRRDRLLRRVGLYLAPILLGLGMVFWLGALGWQLVGAKSTIARLSELGMYIESQNHDFVAEARSDFNAKNLSEVVRLLGRLSVVNLDLSDTRISDISFLSGRLPTLRGLDLSGTSVSDFAPLGRLTQLQRLGLGRTGISDISLLTGLPALRALDLSDTSVSDLAPLGRLVTLQDLNLARTRISDIGLLAELTALQHLDLSGTPVLDFTPLSRLTKLQGLRLERTRISGIGFLTGLSVLQSLDLTDTPVSDFAPLSQLTGLLDLRLGRSLFADLMPLSRLTGLRVLFIDRTPISDFSLLKELRSLQRLSVIGTGLADLEPLGNLSELYDLDLSSTPVSNLGPLTRATKLRLIGVVATRVSDIEPLRDLPGLQLVEVPELFDDAAMERFSEYRRTHGLAASELRRGASGK